MDIWSDLATALWQGLVTFGQWLYGVTLAPLTVALTSAWELTITWLESSGLGIVAVPFTVGIWTISVLLILLGVKIIINNLTSW